MRLGHTLLELTVVLSLTALLSSAALPAAARFRDGRAVQAAREAVVGLLAEARLRALSEGGVDVRVAAEPWRAWIESRGDTLRIVGLEDELGVTLTLSRSRTSVRMPFNAMGLGRFAGQTIRFRRSEAESVLVVSAYGRVRRR